MSEHTPLTEAERDEIADSLMEYRWGSQPAPERAEIVYRTVEHILAARTSTATADDRRRHPGHSALCMERWMFPCCCGGDDAATADTAEPKHTRLDGPHGPPYCLECSEAVQEYVEWPCSPERLIRIQEATADTGLRERVEALRATMPHALDCGIPCNCWKRWLFDALDATPASTD